LHAIYGILRNIAKLVKIDLVPVALSMTEIALKSLKISSNSYKIVYTLLLIYVLKFDFC